MIPRLAPKFTGLTDVLVVGIEGLTQSPPFDSQQEYNPDLRLKNNNVIKVTALGMALNALAQQGDQLIKEKGVECKIFHFQMRPTRDFSFSIDRLGIVHPATRR